MKMISEILTKINDFFERFTFFRFSVLLIRWCSTLKLCNFYNQDFGCCAVLAVAVRVVREVAAVPVVPGTPNQPGVVGRSPGLEPGLCAQIRLLGEETIVVSYNLDFFYTVPLWCGIVL